MKMDIDLRSDTVTHPTSSMRQAMSTADVGDDLYGEDPTVNRLEERAAQLMEREASLLVPSGTMGNQIAVNLLSKRGTEVVGEAGCHIFNFERGAMAALSGTLPRPVRAPDGLLEPTEVDEVIRSGGGFRNSTSLLVLENTHNMAGGRVVPVERTRELVAVAKRHGLPVHLDGARIHNAAAALGVPAARLAEGCDTVMFCLSKGLGAPVGSMLVGDKAAIAEARQIRKMFGGAMRQAGVLAAAGLVAFDEVLPRLADDHATARRLAELLAEIPGIDLNPQNVETNIISFELDDKASMGAHELAERAVEDGVKFSPLGDRAIRMVTHYHIGMEDAERAAGVVRRILG
jgi:threonine aldolase